MRHARRSALLVSGMLGATVAAGLQAAPPQTGGRALTIEDYYRIQSAGGVGLSPNGRWIAYTVSARIEEQENGSRTETWIGAADRSAPPRRIQHEGKDVSSPRWTDDNTLQYAVAKQQWIVDPDNPSATPVQATSASSGERTRSLDGTWIARTVEKPQPKHEPAYASDFEKRHQERFKGAIFDWKDFQRDGAAFPAPNPVARAAQQIVVEPAEGGEPKVVVDMDLRPSGLAWHPNRRMLAFIADSDWRNELQYSRADLWTVTTDGVVTRLTDDGCVYSDVRYSPDGKYLAYARSYGTDMIIQQKLTHGGPRDLYVRPLAGGEPINLTASWDLDPESARWSPDGRFLYFTAEIGGESHLFRVSVPAGRVEQVTSGPRRLGNVSYDKAMTRIAYTSAVHHAPPAIYVANIDGTNERRLTDIHKDIVGEIAFSRTERLVWPSYDGTQIEGWLMFPYGYDPKRGPFDPSTSSGSPRARSRGDKLRTEPYPLIVTSHGGPHSATGYSFDFKKQYFAANGYFVLDTNFRSSTGYGDKFKWATWGAWGDKDGQDVMSGIDFVLKRYPIDAGRVGHTGHSYGGFLTNWLITRYPDRFAAAISGAGISNWISDYGTADIYRTKETEFFGTPWQKNARDRMIRQSPLTYAGNVKTPTLFVHGEVDQRVPYEEGEQMYFALKRRGVPAKMIQYKGQPHGISGNWNVVHRMINELQWWDTYLKPGKRPTPSS